MQKISCLILCMMTLVMGQAFAESDEKKWLACETDTDCTSVMLGCWYWQPVNKKYIEAMKTAHPTICTRYRTVSIIDDPLAETAAINFNIKSVAIGFNPINIVDEFGERALLKPALLKIAGRDPAMRSGAAQILAVIIDRHDGKEQNSNSLPEMKNALKKFMSSTDPNDQNAIEQVKGLLDH